MKRAGATIAAACLIDALLGDPAWLPHPVRAIGAAIALGDRTLNPNGSGSRAAGALLTLGVIGGCVVAGALARRSVIAEIVLGAAMLAGRDLLAEASAVAGALEGGDLARARSRVARIVGRDTALLDAHGIARAAIETLAESACDGIVAPLFWLTIGGVRGALAFKAASTLDSMIGHREPRYRRFGCFAARTDDVLNLIPARLTATLIALVGGNPGRSVGAALADAPRHASPNAGWPEAALAGALGICLGGANTYAGVEHAGARLNPAGRIAQVADIRRAMRVVGRAALLAQICAVAARA